MWDLDRHGGTYAAVHSGRAVKHVLQLEDDGEHGVTDHLGESEAASQNESLASGAGSRTQSGGQSGSDLYCPCPSPPPARQALGMALQQVPLPGQHH